MNIEGTHTHAHTHTHTHNARTHRHTPTHTQTDTHHTQTKQRLEQTQAPHLAFGHQRGEAREVARAGERVDDSEPGKEGCPGQCNGYLYIFKRYWKPTERQGQARRRDREDRVRERVERRERAQIPETLSLCIMFLLVQPIAYGDLQVSRIRVSSLP